MFLHSACICIRFYVFFFFFFFNDTATTEIYTLSLHDALPIYECLDMVCGKMVPDLSGRIQTDGFGFSYDNDLDRKSTRLNSSHGYISYAVFCLKKKTLEQRVTYESNDLAPLHEQRRSPSF